MGLPDLSMLRITKALGFEVKALMQSTKVHLVMDDVYLSFAWCLQA
jgi:hypothetical protein